MKYYSLHYISICERWAWFLLTLPDDLIPLYKQKYTTAQAISKVVASGKRISPGSSIPFEIARIYRLKKKKPKRKYVNDSQRSRRLGVGRGGTQRTACSRHGRKDPYLLWQSSKLLLSEWQRFSKYACKKKENQTLRGCSLFFIRSKATENCTRNITFK